MPQADVFFEIARLSHEKKHGQLRFQLTGRLECDQEWGGPQKTCLLFRKRLTIWLRPQKQLQTPSGNRRILITESGQGFPTPGGLGTALTEILAKS